MPYFDNVFHWCIPVACSDKASGSETVAAGCYTVGAGKCRNIGGNTLVLKAKIKSPKSLRAYGDFYLIYNSQFCCAIVVMKGMLSRRFTSESRTTAKESLFSALIGIFGCDFIVSGLMGLPFSYTRKSR